MVHCGARSRPTASSGHSRNSKSIYGVSARRRGRNTSKHCWHPSSAKKKGAIVCEHVSPETLDAWLRGASPERLLAPLVIDVRGKADYARGHLHGALHIPLAKLAERSKRLPHDRPIVTYCNMHHPGQSRGERAAALLSGEGFQAMAIDGGFTAWEARGLPIETTTQGSE